MSMLRLMIMAGATCFIVLQGCTVGPTYQRPSVVMPATYRSAVASDSVSIGDVGLAAMYRDTVLQRYIARALDSNLDIIATFGRIQAATAQVTIARSDLFPTLDLQASAGAMQMSKNRFPGFSEDLIGGVRGNLGVSTVLSWELDLFGRIRRQTEAEQARLRASEFARRAAQVQTIAAVARTYFQILRLDRLSELMDSTIASRREYVRLARTLFEGGKTSELDLRQAEGELQRVLATAAPITALVQQTENALNVLMGQAPGLPVQRGQKLADQTMMESLPTGLPAGLLNRRPDVLEAEYDLVAANANIGVATAQLFPRIALAGDVGLQSLQAGDLFDVNSLAYTAVGNVVQPLFAAGRNLARVDGAEGLYAQQEARYRRAVLQAIADVNDAWALLKASQQRRAAARQSVEANQAVLRLSELRYRYGTAPYLQVLDAQRSLLQSQQEAVDAEYVLIEAHVVLYRALGGGWQQ